MATEVTIPQLGESVTEGTITEWLFDVGDEVQADQPLFELSSEKIDTEVPSPASGVLTEIRVGIDETVDVGTVVAIIGDAGEAAAGDTKGDTKGDTADTKKAKSDTADTKKTKSDTADTKKTKSDTADTKKAKSDTADTKAADTKAADTKAADTKAADTKGAKSAAAETAGGDGAGATDLMSPIVRRMVAEHDLDVSQIPASGEGGRITRDDVESAIAAKDRAGAESAAGTQADGAGARERTENLSRIRKRIAARMMASIQSSAQLTTVQEADVTRVMRLRARHKDAFRAREGVSLSPFGFLARAAVLALRRHPTLNAKPDWDAGTVTFHNYVNLGVAVDTEKGLIVPNVKNADDLTLAALVRAIADVAGRARGDGGKLEMPDIEGGTFTVTNTGSRGVLMDTPILNHPEVAILGTGAIQKRPVAHAVDEGAPAIAVRDMVYLSLTYDHQLIDGADAARFVTDVAEVIETHDWDSELGY